MADLRQLKLWLDDLVSMVWPNLCEVCDSTLVRGEDTVCLGCLTALPRTNQHRCTFNEIHKRLGRGAPVERAASWFYYLRDTGSVRLIHAAKYHNRPRVGRTLARNFALELMPDGFFDGIDLILPVPLYPAKERRRGFNQSKWIARGISDVTGIPVADNLVSVRDHSTQTRKNAYERMLNAIGTYAVRRSSGIEGKHILIVDDVLTTGATLAACCHAVNAVAPTTRISVLTLAMTRLD